MFLLEPKVSSEPIQTNENNRTQEEMICSKKHGSESKIAKVSHHKTLRDHKLT